VTARGLPNLSFRVSRVEGPVLGPPTWWRGQFRGPLGGRVLEADRGENLRSGSGPLCSGWRHEGASLTPSISYPVNVWGDRKESRHFMRVRPPTASTLALCMRRCFY
jgi:hypothetical protein